MDKKVLKIAAEICWLHASIAGDRTCQDWSGKDDVIDALSMDEKNLLMKNYEDFNSGGEDYEPDTFQKDEMSISHYVAIHLERMLENEPKITVLPILQQDD